ncbi:BMC domain-containing protein [Anaerocolumna aminovalerica]|uniref:BMC domain-containing protein n=1 Tax=Anaerocolumna aminovalerica TaxID=1527 RepID=UPI00248A9779|nr:BMC domain-containing protein [Anaerocolumna aminovalerica]
MSDSVPLSNGEKKKRSLLGIRGRYEPVEKLDAVGIVETRMVCTGIKALDTVLKSADVKILRIYLAFSIGGKMVFAVTGSVSSIEHGISGCKQLLSESERENIAIIPSPNRDILENLLKR